MIGALAPSYPGFVRDDAALAEALASSAPEPTWIVMLTPVALVPDPPAIMEFPVMLPATNCEIPRAVMYIDVGIAVPLTLDAEPEVPPPLEIVDMLTAPGNGVTRARPLVVGTIIPRLFIGAGTIRSSRMHSSKFGFRSQFSLMASPLNAPTAETIVSELAD